MDSLSKRDSDFQKGKERREFVANNLNKYFIPAGFKLIKIPETRQKRGLDYILTKKDGVLGVPILIRFSEDFGFYIKLQKAYPEMNTVETYLTHCKHYQVIFVKKKGDFIYDEYAGPTSISNISSHCKYWLAGSEGNTNRLCFDYNPDKLNYISPDRKGLVMPSAIDKLINIYYDYIHGDLVV